MQSHIQQICINMIVMECGSGRSASGSWENYRAVHECRHITALFVLGFGTRKIFSKHGSSQYVLPLGALTLQACVCSQIGCRDTEHTTTLSMRENGLNETSKWGL
jgi:hypothetical protein